MRVPEAVEATLPVPKQRQGEGLEVEPPPQSADERLTAGGYLVPDDDGAPPRIAGSGRTTGNKKRRARGVEPSGPETAIWDGFIAAPKRPEERLRESLWYPLWGATGVASLVILPPLLWITSYFVFAGVMAVFSGGGGGRSLIGLLFLLPTSLGLFAVGGYALLFLARVLASSALGEVHHPRWPDWEPFAIAAGLGRWLWAGFVGGVVGGVPAVAYWVYCGDIDLFDTIILTELIALGAVYALMALMASILHEDLWAANPLTVFVAIYRVGWGYARPCLVCGAAVTVAGTLLAGALETGDAVASAFLFFAFWVVGLYLAMVVLRVLGLYYHQNARVLGWFRGRTGWGV
jgi:hypothetical protein